MYKSAFTACCEEMSDITVSDARARLADVVDSARVGHDPIYLTRRAEMDDDVLLVMVVAVGHRRDVCQRR